MAVLPRGTPRVRLFDTRTGRAVFTLPGQYWSPTGLAFSRSGDWLALGSDYVPTPGARNERLLFDARPLDADPAPADPAATPPG